MNYCRYFKPIGQRSEIQAKIFVQNQRETSGAVLLNVNRKITQQIER